VTRSDRGAPARTGRGGFTLIELLVALLVGATIVLGARLMLEGTADQARRITALARHADHDANAERLLRATVAALDLGATPAQTFKGDEREAHFTSWCTRPGGWQERCAVTLSIVGDSAVHALVLTLPGDEPFRIRAGPGRAELRYLVDAHDGGRWFRSWDEQLTAPLAIGAIVGTDTLVLAIGERG
jgi:prepilin-type N-terminal cleavage/methylation domain-containing protein